MLILNGRGFGHFKEGRPPQLLLMNALGDLCKYVVRRYATA